MSHAPHISSANTDTIIGISTPDTILSTSFIVVFDIPVIRERVERSIAKNYKKQLKNNKPIERCNAFVIVHKHHAATD